MNKDEENLGDNAVNNKSSKVYLFYCSSSFDAVETALRHGENGEELKAIPIPCSGKIDILYLTKAFETGADGVAVLMCPEGECRYLEGNLRARKRAEAIEALLEEIGLGKGRVAVMQMGEGGMEPVIRAVEEFRARIKALPRMVPGADVPVRAA
jgi:F420-non-reducing hydrogenase iron-sulfur subunit